MIKVNKESQRGKGNYGWLNANYSFSFSNYYNPAKMGYKSLRVINEDFVAPNSGFPTHAHKNMEIITYIIKGELTHKDSMGNVATLRPERIQRMYAGKGVGHSEYNASSSEELNLLQVWIEPHTLNLPSEYNELAFSEQAHGEQLLASPIARPDAIKVYQNVEISLISLEEGKSLNVELKEFNYLHIISGKIESGGQTAQYGDSFEIEGLSEVTLKADQNSKVLAFKF